MVCLWDAKPNVFEIGELQCEAVVKTGSFNGKYHDDDGVEIIGPVEYVCLGYYALGDVRSFLLIIEPLKGGNYRRRALIEVDDELAPMRFQQERRQVIKLV